MNALQKNDLQGQGGKLSLFKCPKLESSYVSGSEKVTMSWQFKCLTFQGRVTGIGISVKVITDTKNIANVKTAENVRSVFVAFNKDMDVLKIEKFCNTHIICVELKFGHTRLYVVSAYFQHCEPIELHFGVSFPLFGRNFYSSNGVFRHSTGILTIDMRFLVTVSGFRPQFRFRLVFKHFGTINTSEGVFTPRMVFFALGMVLSHLRCGFLLPVQHSHPISTQAFI